MRTALLHRARLAFDWQRQKMARRTRRWLVSRGSAGYIRWRWPWPLKKPWQRAHLRLVTYGGGLGDELLCTPIFREIRRRNPRCHLTFVSRHPEIFQGNTHLDCVEPFSPEKAAHAIYLGYDAVLPPPRPLVTLLAECVGLELSANRLEPPQVEPSPMVRARVAAIPAPRVVIQPQASGWTPNKQWPVESWKTLVAQLTEHCDVIEVGMHSLFAGEDFGPRFHSLNGATSVAEFAWVISQATVFVGPPSGGMHCANAFGIPTIAIFGGYEAPDGYDYPWVARFFTPVECAPCWLETLCPYDRKCLCAIQPDQILRAILKAVEKAAATAA